MILYFVIIVAGIILDQVTKWIAVVQLKGNPSFPLWEGVLHFTYLENTGAAFGILKGNRWVFMLISSVAIIAMLYYLARYRPKDKIMGFGLSLIISGGIGNMIDRIVTGLCSRFYRFYLD